MMPCMSEPRAVLALLPLLLFIASACTEAGSPEADSAPTSSAAASISPAEAAAVAACNDYETALTKIKFKTQEDYEAGLATPVLDLSLSQDAARLDARWQRLAEALDKVQYGDRSEQLSYGEMADSECVNVRASVAS